MRHFHNQSDHIWYLIYSHVFTVGGANQCDIETMWLSKCPVISPDLHGRYVAFSCHVRLAHILLLFFTLFFYFFWYNNFPNQCWHVISWNNKENETSVYVQYNHFELMCACCLALNKMMCNNCPVVMIVCFAPVRSHWCMLFSSCTVIHTRKVNKTAGVH